ncbi:unnamed protein product [Rhizophagus irregularis]|uniref:Uncharacterized protein n=1 Tax=Rhizophagus irregularis TaxID=588596 RepID=A0A2I1G1M7_9GLOM|nr:hypothetical protein RhiirA4_352953 [Rhizophagus irregularis]CAB4404990.1 unnamed protein product [Rhizophagus irregularis]
MSQEDNQSVPPTQASAIAGSSVNSSVEPSEGPHRISINDPRSNPTTPTLLTPKLRRLKSYDDDDDDDDDYDYDSGDSKRRKRKGLRKRHSYRRRKSSVSSHVEDDAIDENQNEDEIDEDESDHEPVTLKDRQEAINITHPFGLPIWKPALYKKSRSVTRNANSALHSVPSPDLYISFGNIFWAICFGWWLAMISFVVSIILFLTPFEGWRYAQVLQELSLYILWPFGKFVEKDDDLLDDTSSHEQQTDYFSHHDVDIEESETRPLLGRSLYINSRRNSRSEKFNLFEKLDEIGPSGVFFYFLFYTVLAPSFFFVSVICWLSVFPIPMAKLIFELLKHLNRKPLSLHFKSGSSRTTSRSAVLLCTYRAFGLQYYKYTYEGINIMFINLMPIVFFVIIDDRFLKHKFKDYFFSTEEFIFALSLASVIPLSYFIGTAVASISAQSSIGLGAVINATFGSIIEIILYAIALNRGKGKLTEGSIIGSIMAGVLLMPGVSMVSGGFKRKEQNFNSKSAGVTSTMLIMAIIGAFTPTLFFQTYAPYKMSCKPCDEALSAESCQICSHSEVEPIETPLYKDHVKPLMYFCSIILLLSYLIGLWFSLRTHAALVYQTPQERPERPQSIYQRWVPVNIIQQLLPHSPNFLQQQQQHINPQNEHLPPPLPRAMSAPSSAIPIQSILVHNDDDNTINLASVANQPTINLRHANEPEEAEEEEEEVHGHDSPNWGKFKSGFVLLSCTALYSFIAEILVENVTFVLKHVNTTEKILGLTLFALVPNVTEFLNAMLFSLYGNIALSMEIGSAYALQVCLLQIPAMVAYSAWVNRGKTVDQQKDRTFTLVFPKWDVFAVVFSVFLLTYTYIEGKSNYFKGSILILSYAVLMAGFFYAPSNYDSYIF